MQTVRQRNIALEWWFLFHKAVKIYLAEKYGFTEEQVAPKTIDFNIPYSIFEKETGKKISEL